MTQCIEFFKKIDPDVTRISTIAGKEPDTVGGEWLAFPPS
jgi:hypothetical protein